MTKFEEELKNKGVEIFTHMDGCTISKKVCINYADVVNLSEGWVSPEEHQARVNELIEAKEKKIKQLRKINHLYKKAKENAERLAVDRGERFNQAQDELASLESQLQQQALPVVPECVGEWIECVKKDELFNALGLLDNDNMPKDVDEWLFLQSNDDNINLILRAWLDGYTVEKPQLFYIELPNVYVLKNKVSVSKVENGTIVEFSNGKNYALKLTEQEIKSIDERYWQFAVPVEDGE